MQLIKCDVCWSNKHYEKTDKKIKLPVVPKTEPMKYILYDVYYCDNCGNGFLIKDKII